MLCLFPTEPDMRQKSLAVSALMRLSHKGALFFAFREPRDSAGTDHQNIPIFRVLLGRTERADVKTITHEFRAEGTTDLFRIGTKKVPICLTVGDFHSIDGGLKPGPGHIACTSKIPLWHGPNLFSIHVKSVRVRTGDRSCANVCRTYRHNAAEELDCIPTSGAGSWLSWGDIRAPARARRPGSRRNGKAIRIWRWMSPAASTCGSASCWSRSATCSGCASCQS